MKEIRKPGPVMVPVHVYPGQFNWMEIRKESLKELLREQEHMGNLTLPDWERNEFGLFVHPDAKILKQAMREGEANNDHLATAS